MAPPIGPPRIDWLEQGLPRSAHWRSERGLPPPARVVVIDDTLTADAAWRLACEGTAMLFRGDYHNARQLLAAMARRIDRKPAAKRRGRARGDAVDSSGSPDAMREAFHQHRQAQAQRARLLGRLLVPCTADYQIALARSPDVREACEQAWGEPGEGQGESIVSLREILGVIGAQQWREKGVPIAALGPGPDNRVRAHYGVFSPVRGEYLGLVGAESLPMADPGAALAFDIGTGTGVLAILLARRGIGRIVATDIEPRALACAADNLARLAPGAPVSLLHADLFPPGRADLIVCNPPWLPVRPGAPIEQAIYDEGGRVLQRLLQGSVAHLTERGQLWLVLSDLAEHLGLRTREQFLAAVAAAGLQVLGRSQTRPVHPRAVDAADPLHAARVREVTSLWRLARPGTDAIA